MIPVRHSREVVVAALDHPIRLDKFLAENLGLFPRSQYERRVVEVLCNGKALRPSFKVEGGELFLVTWCDLPSVSFEAEEIPLDIIYEDASTVVINKPRGMVVHPAQGNWTGTLVQALLFHVKDLDEQFDSELRPGIVHRLDKETTGVLVTAKSPAALEMLAAQFRDRTTQKVYFAVLKGELNPTTGQIDRPLSRDPLHRQKFAVAEEGRGKPALTAWKVLARVKGYTLVEYRPQTGRTHQLRVHSLALKCPILGDPLYARPDSRIVAPLMLHAGCLTLQLPGETSQKTFTAPPPEDFRTILRSLGLPDPPSCAPD